MGIFKKENKYVVERKNVYAGQVIAPFGVSVKLLNEQGEELEQEEIEKPKIGIVNIQACAGLVYRSMLFKIDDNGLAEDLLFDSPRYPISTLNVKTKTDNSVIINHAVNLEELLKYLKYDEQLTRPQINEIFKLLICNNNWLNSHHELFGWKKCLSGYSSGGIETISRDIYDNLSWISCSKNGEPHKEEQTHQLIKKL